MSTPDRARRYNIFTRGAAKVVLGFLAVSAALGVAGGAAVGVHKLDEVRSQQFRADYNAFQGELHAKGLDTAHRILTHQAVSFVAGRLVCNGGKSGSFYIENPFAANVDGVLAYGYASKDDTSPNGVTVTYFNAYGSNCQLQDEPANTIGTGTYYNALLAPNPDAQDGTPLYGKDAGSPDSYQVKGGGSDGTFLDQAGNPVAIAFKYTPAK